MPAHYPLLRLVRALLADGKDTPVYARFMRADGDGVCGGCERPASDGEGVIDLGGWWAHVYDCESRFAHAGGLWHDHRGWWSVCACSWHSPPYATAHEADQAHLAHGVTAMLGEVDEGG